MRDPELGKSTFYHVFNRGVDKRNVFADRGDFLRFYQSLYLFNDKHYSHRNGREVDKTELVSSWEIHEHERSPLVQIVAFFLSGNHFHLLLRQKEDDGISRFLHRLSMGYSKYFNYKYNRSGALFEGAFKAVPTDFDEHLEHLPRYIHLNALDHSAFRWRDGQIDDWDGALDFLNDYEWSSHHVYSRQEQILPVLDTEWINRRFPKVLEYLDYLKEWAGRNSLPELLSVTECCPSPSDGQDL